MAAAKSKDTCPECGQDALENETCASEDIVVCQNCGHIVESGSIDTSKEYVGNVAGQMTGTTRSYRGNGIMSSICRAEVFSSLSRCRRIKMKSLTAHLEIIAERMKLEKHQKQVVMHKIEEIVQLDDYSSWRPHEAVVAGIVYVCLFNGSPTTLKALKCHVTHKKSIKKISEKLKCLSSEEKSETVTRSLRTMFIDRNDAFKICTIEEETKKCIDMCEELWEILQETETNDLIICSVFVIALEHIQKKKDQELQNRIAKQLQYQTVTLKRALGTIRGKLLKLCKLIPSLGDDIEQGTLSVYTVTRYIPTLVSNKIFLSSLRQTLNEDKPPEPKKRKKVVPPSVGEPCVPMDFNWPVDDSESLGQLDIDQYLATDLEIEAKKKALTL